ncbi:MAG: SDH family Clp fold serine proteinase [Moorellales bacterium]
MRERRIELIRAIEERRDSRVIAYFTGDRENVSTRVAPDVLRVFYRHLEALGRSARLDLFLYTRGGDVLTPWRLINLLREYADRLAVLVPFRAYSAGTLICLGADEIVMGRMGELGPIDPSVANAFNPQDPTNPTARIPVSVEDVSSYISLAQEMAGLRSEEQLGLVFRFLSEKVHPLALGNVHRNYVLIRSLARKLLRLHLGSEEEPRIESIVANLTARLYSHNHMISRREAREDIGLPVVYADPELEGLMWRLYECYETDLRLNDPFNPAELVGEQQRGPVNFEAVGGLVESRACLDAFIFQGTVTRLGTGPEGSPRLHVNMTGQRWSRIV